MPPSLLWARNFLSVLVLVLFLARAADVSATCLSNQSSALLQFKQGLSLPQPDALSSWQNGTDCCSWAGVTCNSFTGFVVSLQLSGVTAASPTARVLQKSSRFDQSLFNLRQLRFLDLSYISFEGQMPSRFVELRELTKLNLSNTNFSGQVPAEISRMTWLVSLDLSVSYLNSPSLKLENPNFVDLVKNLTQLNDLRLDGVNISMSGDACSFAIASSLPHLQNLSLSTCLIFGPMNESILGVRSLLHLDLSRNNLSNIPDFFVNLTELKFLGLSSCSLSGTVPPGIFWLPNLQFLDIGNNPNLHGSFPDRLPSSSKLRVLNVYFTNLTGSIPDSIGNLTELNVLKISGCKFAGSISSSLSNLTQLRIIDMSFNNLSGRIPPLSARTIVQIDFSWNVLTGSIPESFGKLDGLMTLNLKNNLLSGQIPSALLNLPSLKTVDLSQNNLTGSLSIFSNASSLLESIDLSNNSLSGWIPSTVSSLSKLKVIVLSSNDFSGTIDISSFMGLMNLSKLDLSDNRLTVVETSSRPLARLTALRLSSCNISSLPHSIRAQQNLTILDLGNNTLSGSVPSWLWKVSNLQYLNLSHNMLSSLERPMDVGRMKRLFMLDLNSNSLSGDLPPFPPTAIFLDFSSNRFTSSIPSSNSTSLLYLSISNNNITGAVPNSICGHAILNVLDLSNNGLNGSIPSCLTSLTGLSILNLRKNQLTGPIPDEFNSDCSIRTLNLNDNRLTGTIPKSLRNCSSLEVLDLSNNDLIDYFPGWLGCLNQLRVLALRSNRLNGSISLVSEKAFTLLQIIDVSHNYLSGILPPELFKILTGMTKIGPNNKATLLGFPFLRNVYYQDTVAATIKGVDFQMVKIMNILTSIDLSGNRFSGEIPEEIGTLKGLRILNLSSNAIGGSIPKSLGNLLQLESLDLSANRLSGNIPVELLSLTFLAVLNLSFNDLKGQIPQGKQFFTFDAASFEGNLELCGPPLKKNCTNSINISKVPTAIVNKRLKVEYIAPGLGFGAGMALFAIPIFFMKKKRKWYFDLVDGVIVTLLFVPIDWFYSHYRKMKDEGAVKDDVNDNSEDDDEQGEKLEKSDNSGRHFCVYCTKLEPGATRAVHKECSCFASDSIPIHPP